jgi:hypothetical protein
VGCASRMQLAGQFAYISLSNNRLLTIDVSNPGSPTVSSESSFGVESLRAFQVVGSLIYLANSSGLSVWDISTPTSPVRVAQSLDPLDRGARAAGPGPLRFLEIACTLCHRWAD